MIKVQNAEQILESASKDDLIELFRSLANQEGQRINKITIEELCIKNLQYCKAREFEKGTIEKYKLAHRYLRQYCENRGLNYADEITIDYAEEYYNFLMKHPGFLKKDGTLSKSFIIGIYKNTKAMFAYAEKRDHIVKNPFENKVYPQSQVTEYWTDEYVETLIKAIDKHMKKRKAKFLTKIKVRLTYTTGLRAGIIHGIRRKDVIMEEDEILINTKCKVPKSAKIQRVTTPILNNKVKTMIREHIKNLDQNGIKPDKNIFVKNGNRKNGYNNYRIILVDVCKKAGIPYIIPHGAKHGFITKMAKNSFTAEEICKLTGNRTPKLLNDVYMHLQLRDVKGRAKEVLENI